MSIVGILQYVSLTRPDVAFLVNKIFQYLYAPITEHMVAAKRILRYIQRPIGLGIKFVIDSFVSIIALSDADWDGCIDDKRSTGGLSSILERI